MLNDLRLAFRSLRRTPGFTAVVVLTLALGIGANTAIFSVVNSVLLTPLHYRDPSRLMVIWEGNSRGNPRNVVDPVNFLDWRDRNHSFSDITAFTWRGMTMTGGSPEHIEGRAVTANFFTVLGVSPEIGRGFTAEEAAPGGPKVVVLSHAVWQRRFGGDPSIIGRAIPVAGGAVQVLGVMPASFQPMPYGPEDQYWEPFRLDPADRGRKGRYAMTIGRLRDGVTVDAAQRDMTGLAADLSREHPESNTGWGASVVPLTEQVVGGSRAILWTLLGAVALVLMIACANVANLMLVRATGRRREFALRAALGAGRGRLLRERLAESLLLAVAGGAGGGMLAAWGIELLTAGGSVPLPKQTHVTIDGRVLLVTAVVTIAVGVLFGLAGAWENRAGGLAAALHGAGRRTTSGTRTARVRGGLVIAQVSLAVVLLVGAGLLVRSLQRLMAVDPGFDPRGVLTVGIDLPGATYARGPRQTAFYASLLQRTRAMPGVESASLIDFIPLAGEGAATSFSVVGQPAAAPGQAPVADIKIIDPDYFKVMQIGLKRGRALADRDAAGGLPVVVINEWMARALWPNADPVGQQIKVDMWAPDQAVIVAGVVADVQNDGLDGGRRAMIYYPLAQVPNGSMTLLVKTSGDPLTLAAPVRAAVRGLDADLPLGEVTSMQNRLLSSISDRRFPMFVLTIFALLAVVLAAVGIYGVLSYTVGQRTQEIGVRMALGAQVRDIIHLVGRQGVMLVGGGALMGLVAALALSRVLKGLLFGITGSDPLTY